MDISPREPVIFAVNFKTLIAWYQAILKFEIINLFEDEYHYCVLKNQYGLQIGIADAKEMGVIPVDRKMNTVVLQFQVPDLKAFFKHLQLNNASVTFGPSLDKKGDFWYGGFTDLEGNPIWVVDKNCP